MFSGFLHLCGSPIGEHTSGEQQVGSRLHSKQHKHTFPSPWSSHSCGIRQVVVTWPHRCTGPQVRCADLSLRRAVAYSWAHPRCTKGDQMVEEGGRTWACCRPRLAMSSIEDSVLLCLQKFLPVSASRWNPDSENHSCSAHVGRGR